MYSSFTLWCYEACKAINAISHHYLEVLLKLGICARDENRVLRYTLYSVTCQLNDLFLRAEIFAARF